MVQSANKIQSVPKARSSAAIDVAKYVFAVMIMMLHSGFELGPFGALYRIPVPCFFLFSSFFLFKKIGAAQDEAEQRRILKSFVLRNLKLYAFWFIVQFPILLSHQDFEKGSAVWKGVLFFLRNLCFGSTFTASWYIVATIMDCCLIYFLSKKLGRKAMLALGALAYLACLLYSNYYGLVRDSYLAGFVLTAFTRLFCSVVTGFPAGILWIVLGKILAETPYTMKKSYYWILLAGLVGLIAEELLIRHLGWRLVNDQFIMLIPTCLATFQILRGVSWEWKHSLVARNMSTIIFASHGCVLMLIRPLIAGWGIEPQGVLRAGMCFLVVTMLGAVILALEKRKMFSWLRYAH